MVDFATGAPVTGSLDVQWIHGARGEPAIQVHRYDEHTVILRQGKALSYEAPFLFLLFGNERALLLDTGATAQLTAVRDAAAAVAGRRGVYRFDDFIIYNEPRRAYHVKLLARGLAHRIGSGRS